MYYSGLNWPVKGRHEASSARMCENPSRVRLYRGGSKGAAYRDFNNLDGLDRYISCIIGADSHDASRTVGPAFPVESVPEDTRPIFCGGVDRLGRYLVGFEYRRDTPASPRTR